MEITTFIERSKEQKVVILGEKLTVKDLLTKLAINPETVLVVKTGNVILPDNFLKDKDEIRLISVVSGG